MRKILNKFFGKINLCAAVNALALLLAIDTVNSACIWVMYQPDVPTELKEYKK